MTSTTRKQAGIITLGARYKDLVSGFEGVAIGTSEWLTGCSTVGLQTLHEAKPLTEWFDVTRVERLDGDTVAITTTVDPGGPHDTPGRQQVPGAAQ